MDVTSQRSASLNAFNLDDDEFFNGRCAEVYLTNKRKFMISCLLCDEKFEDFDFVKQHVEIMHNFECFPIVMENVKEEYIAFDECVSNIDYEEFTENTQLSESSTEDNDLDMQVKEEPSNILQTIINGPVEEEVWSITPYKTVNVEPSTADETIEEITYENNELENVALDELHDDEDELTFHKTDDMPIMEKNIEYENIDEADAHNEFKKRKLTRRIPKKMHTKKTRPNNSNSERIHICPICNFAFTDKSNLNAHIRRHGDEKKYECSECTKRFFTRTELETHVRYHTGERPYICSSCGKGCLTAGELNVHERRHTNDRRYKCEYCDKSFFNNKHLKDHIVSHTQERKHVCHICNSRFLRRKSLKSHIKIHENKREYVCNICGNAYNQRPALSIHIKSKHGVHLHKPGLD